MKPSFQPTTSIMVDLWSSLSALWSALPLWGRTRLTDLWGNFGKPLLWKRSGRHQPLLCLREPWTVTPHNCTWENQFQNQTHYTPLSMKLKWNCYPSITAANKCYTWINFSWVIGTGSVIAAPGQKWLPRRFDRNKQGVVSESETFQVLCRRILRFSWPLNSERNHSISF